MHDDISEWRDIFIAEMGLVHASKEEQDQLIEKFGVFIVERAFEALYRGCPESRRQEFRLMLEEQTSDRTHAFIRQHIPRSEHILGAELDGALVDFRTTHFGNQ
jgi:hypothetical protein